MILTQGHMHVVRCSVEHNGVLLKSRLGIHSSPIIHTVEVPNLIVSSHPLYYTFLCMPVICHACIIAFVYGGSRRKRALVCVIYRYFGRPEIESKFGFRRSCILPCICTTVLQQHFKTRPSPAVRLLAVIGSVIRNITSGA